MKRFFAGTLLILILGITSSAYMIFAKPMITRGDAPKVITVYKSKSASYFVHSLCSEQIFTHPKMLLLFMRVLGKTTSLKAGIYEVSPRESAWQFIKRVTAGDILVLPFTIIDGTTVNDVNRALEHAPFLITTDSHWSSIKGNFDNAEGMLLADTYYYDAGTKAIDLLEHAHKFLKDFLDESWQNRADGLPYQTPYELLIVASIIEKEASLTSEKKIISGVIKNRLKKNMRLQMDPTVIYGLQEKYKGALSRQDLNFDSPYNTYKNKGLPPTPIAMVGKSAIEAAAHPRNSNNLYYVAKGDGTHEFSQTYNQQKIAIKKYRKRDN